MKIRARVKAVQELFEYHLFPKDDNPRHLVRTSNFCYLYILELPGNAVEGVVACEEIKIRLLKPIWQIGQHIYLEFSENEYQIDKLEDLTVNTENFLKG